MLCVIASERKGMLDDGYGVSLSQCGGQSPALS